MNNFHISDDLLEAIRQGRTVLVASRRAARAVQIAYALHARELGRAAWRTPDVMTIPAWMERSFLRYRAVDGAERLLPGAHVAALWDRVVAETSFDVPLINPSGLARAAQRAWSRATSWRVGIARIAADAADESQALAGWIDRFRQQCATHGWLAGSDMANWLMRRAQPLRESLLVAQPAELAPLERDLFNTLAAQGTDVHFARGPSELAAAVVCAARDQVDELQRAADWARRQVETGSTAVGIVVPDLADRLPEVRRILEDCFVPGARRIGAPAAAAPFEVAAARSLDQFALVRAALDVLELVRGRSNLTLIGRALASPFVADGTTEAAARALLDTRLRREGREHYSLAALERAATVATCGRLAERLAASRLLVQGLPRYDLPSGWAERFLQMLTVLGWPGERALDSEERQTVEKFRDALGLFGTLDEILGAVDWDGARREFVRTVSATRFEPRTLPAPVTVIDPDTVVGMRFDALWIAGMDANRWPPPSQPDPLLPLALQVEAGMPWATAAATRQHASMRLAALLQSASRATVSWCQWDGDAEQRASPWISRWPPAETPDPQLRAYRHSLFTARPACEWRADQGAPPLSHARAAGGARVIELQSWCPFRAQVELRLHARPLDQPGPEVDPLERGQLAHAALDDLWCEIGSQAALGEIAPALLEEKVRAAVDRRAQKLLTGATAHRARLVHIETGLACARILELLALELRRAPFRVHRRPELGHSLSLGGLQLELRIDRVDELDSGELIIIDYKTGASANARQWHGVRPGQPQLPLYAVAYRDEVAAVAFATLARGRVGYQGVSRRAGLLPGVDAWPTQTPSAPAVTWSDLLEGWHANLETLARQHASGHAAVEPLPQACRYCHLAVLCRVSEADRPDVDTDGRDDD